MPLPETNSTPNRRKPRTLLIIAVTASLVLASATVAVITGSRDLNPVTATTSIPNDVPPAVSEKQLASLPAATYDAVIPELLAYSGTNTATITAAYRTAAGDVPVFGRDRSTPIAKLPAKNFLNEDTIIVPVRTNKHWALALTPARQTKPSTSGGVATAQTAGWVPMKALTRTTTLDAAITISATDQTMTITRADQEVTYNIGVGTPNTPTPTNTTGYLQARYDDPDQATYPVQLTTLHSANVDDPAGGTDGGLIAAHYNTTNTGAVSHGCIRLTAPALAAINQLPLGTPLAITN